MWDFVYAFTVQDQCTNLDCNGGGCFLFCVARLLADLYHMLKIAPRLIQEMLNLMQQAWLMQQYQRRKGVYACASACGLPLQSVQHISNLHYVILSSYVIIYCRALQRE